MSVSRRVFLLHLEADLRPYANLTSRYDRDDPWVNYRALAANLQFHEVFKKYEERNDAADEAALKKFLDVCSTVRNWRLSKLPSWDEELFGELKSTLDNFFHPRGGLMVPDYVDLFNKGDVGPGSSLMGVGGDFYSKMFSSSLTTTSLQLYKTYRKAIDSLPTWFSAEINRLEQCGGPKVVQGNRLSFVPKNVDISRTICTEPTLNMWYQLGLGNIIADRLKSFYGIDLTKAQDGNRELVRLGSLTGEFCTIDLESASDSMGLKMLKKVLPLWVYRLLIDLRSPETLLPDGRRVKLPMVSTMGNGYTFPLQTAIFAAVVSAVYSQQGIPRKRVDCNTPNWSVFGDDIIVRQEAYSRVVHLLTLLGFKVNRQKSFSEGPFRESCGADFHNGFNIRPVYIRSLDDSQDVYSAYNRLVRWSASTGIEIQGTLAYLLKKARFIPVPNWEADDAGFKVPFSSARKQVKFDINGSIVYKAVETRYSRIWLTDEHVRVPRGHKKRKYNPDGLMLSVVKGEFRGGALVPRQGTGKPRILRKVALNWDYPPVPGHLLHQWLRTDSCIFRSHGSCKKVLSPKVKHPVGDSAG